MLMLDIKKAYQNFTIDDNFENFSEYEISYMPKTSESLVLEDCIKKSIKYNNFLSNKKIKIYFDLCDENNIDWLKYRLKEKNFIKSFRSNEIYGAEKVTGSGGMASESIGYVWQITGSKCKKNELGILKTLHHLYVHVAQVNFFLNSEYNIYHFPYWFIEGHADYSSIASVSKDFEDFEKNRKIFINKKYVPEEIKKNISSWSYDQWLNSFYKSEEKRDILEPASSELYSGFFMFEFLLKERDKKNIFYLYSLSTKYKDFRKAFLEIYGEEMDIFYKKVIFEIMSNLKEVL